MPSNTEAEMGSLLAPDSCGCLPEVIRNLVLRNHSPDPSEEKAFSLAMTGLGASPDDDIAAGIHLRWMFHPQLGFPPDGFKLYRRKHDPQHHGTYNFNEIASPVNLPLILRESGSELKLKLTSPERGQISSNRHLFSIPNQLKIKFSIPIALVQLKGILTQSEKLFFTARFEGVTIEIRELKGSSNADFTLDFHANHFDELIIKGPQIRLHELSCWWCKEEAATAWEGPLNSKCGLGLPFGPFSKQNTKLVEKLKLKLEDKTAFAQQMISCRLDGIIPSSLSRETISQLQEVVSAMEKDGVTIPVGWSFLQEPSEANKTDKETPNVILSPYDLLLLEAEDPVIAKILGLYWIDDEVLPQTNNAETLPDPYYDYKIVAEWPTNTLGKLEKEVTFEDITSVNFSRTCFFSSFEGVLISGPISGLVDMSSEANQFARVSQALQFDSTQTHEVILTFPKPVSEVQLFLIHHGQELTALGFSSPPSTEPSPSSTPPIVENTLIESQGVIQLRGENIQFIRLKGEKIALARLHYNETPLPYGQHHYILCALKVNSSTPLETPKGVVGHSLKSMLDVNENNITGKKLRAGLRWNIPKNGEDKLPVSSAVAYHVYRNSSTGWDKLTKDNPIHVVPPDAESSSCRLVETSQEPPECVARPYFVDTAEQDGTYQYAVTSIDLFGRESEKSVPVPVKLEHILPPPPRDLTAQYLDKTSLDPNHPQNVLLSGSDKAVLASETSSGIIVRWKWTKAEQDLATKIDKFIILFHPGWLNLFKGTASQVQRVSPLPVAEEDALFARLALVEEFEFSATADRTIPTNSLQGEWMRQGQRLLLIRSNTSGSAGQSFKIRVKGAPKALGLPYTISFIEEMQMPLAFDMDFSEHKPQEGQEFVIPLTQGAAKDYTKPENWSLADPLEVLWEPGKEDYEKFIPSNAFFPNPQTLSSHKLDYCQVAICSAFSTSHIGRVSAPVAVMAMDSTSPPQSSFAEIEPLQATPANLYGKSAITLIWPTSPHLQYDVYRAQEDTLWTVDRQLRQEAQRDRAFYEQLPGITQELIDNLLSSEPDYSQEKLPYRIRLALAARTNAAFTKITEYPWSPHPEGYTDKTLDGQGDNRYYYRIQAVDEIGNRSALSPSTLLVQVPQVTPPQSPLLTKIVGGDRQMILYWSANPETRISEYQIYRTDVADSAQDIRLMRRVHVETVTEPLMQRHWIDSQVINGRPYWYRLVSVDELGNRSLSQKLVVAQACRMTPPFPPEWVKVEWSSGQIVLEWNPSEEGLLTLVQRYNSERKAWVNLTNWLATDITSFADETANSQTLNSYRLKCCDRAGNMNTIFMTRAVSPP